MATYAEIDSLLAVDEPSGLRRRVAVATLVAANAIRLEVDDQSAGVRQRKRFAQQVFKTMLNTDLFLHRDDNADLALTGVFEAIYRSVLIANIGATKANISGATDSAIQSAVNDAVDLLAASFPDPVPAP